ncbi:hypothetical protein LNP74_28725 [Klebsiella pneumoniae subsp. pneumoniae]|nr:hypothetical protein [Klebsiella pneumoniae subsp. pneumoniae]
MLEDSPGIGEELEQERWPGSSTATSASGRPPSTIRSVWRCSASFVNSDFSPTRLCSAAICAVAAAAAD